MHILSINHLLKDIKSEICVDFICSDNRRIINTTNKVASALNINIIEKYMKNLNNVNLNKVISLRLFQSKSYLKILGILYFIKNTNLLIPIDIIETVIKHTHIFKNTILTLCSQIIKASSKSDIAII